MSQSVVTILTNVAGLVGLFALLLYVGTDRQIARRPPLVLGLVITGCLLAAVIRVVLLLDL